MRNLILAAALVVAAGAAGAEGVGITRDVASVEVPTPSGPLVISRVQDTDNELSGEWARTSRECPPFCIQPIRPVDGVQTIGELELLDMLADPGTMVIDSRVPKDFDGGAIPGAISIPYTQMVDHLGELGCEIDFDGWDCEEATPVALYCNGPWCGQSPEAIRRMVEAGYPPERIYYYRGGMQVWRMLGLTVTGDG